MKRHFLIVVTGMVLAVTANAGNLTKKSVEKAQAVIDAAVEAYGGADALTGLNSVIVEHETQNIAVRQSLGTEAPWDRNRGSGRDAIDLEQQTFATTAAGEGGGFEFDGGTIVKGEEAWQLDHRAGSVTPLLEPDFATTSGPFVRVTPALLVRQAHDRSQTAYYLGEVKLNSASHDVVGFSMEVGPAISLYFDKKTHLLSHSERMLPGVGLVEYEFIDYKKIEGIPFNQRFELSLDGDVNMLRRNLSTRVNAPVEQYATLAEDLTRVDAQAPDEFGSQEIADGVYLIGGNGTYALFVEMDDHVIAVGGTAGTPERIAELRTIVEDKPLTYGLITHQHFDHVVAVPDYVDEGATVLAAAAHESVIREAAGEDKKMKLETVAARKVLTDGNRTVEIIDIGPTAHTEHLLVAWLPAEGILFEADHFSMPRSGPVPPAVSSTRTFAKALRTLEIEPAIIASAHSPKTGTMADLKAALEKKPLKKEKVAAR